MVERKFEGMNDGNCCWSIRCLFVIIQTNKLILCQAYRKNIGQVVFADGQQVMFSKNSWDWSVTLILRQFLENIFYFCWRWNATMELICSFFCFGTKIQRVASIKCSCNKFFVWLRHLISRVPELFFLKSKCINMYATPS